MIQVATTQTRSTNLYFKLTFNLCFPELTAAVKSISPSYTMDQLRLLNLPSATFNNCMVKFYVQSSANTDHAVPKGKRRTLVIDSDSDSN